MGRPHQRRHSPIHWLNATMNRYADGLLTGTIALPFHILAASTSAPWEIPNAIAVPMDIHIASISDSNHQIPNFRNRYNI